jgi:hypothetical protein
MIEKSVLISYSTPNYNELFTLFYNSAIAVGFSNIIHKLDDNVNINFEKGGEYQSDLWYYCIEQKMLHLINTLKMFIQKHENAHSTLPNYFIFSDCDIVFIKENKLQWVVLENYIKTTTHDIYFMQEYNINNANVGFYIIKSEKIYTVLSYFINIHQLFLTTNKKDMPQGDQTLINNTIFNLNYGYIPIDYYIWGNHIWNPTKSLFHHAVDCKNINEKQSQIQDIGLFFQKYYHNYINSSKKYQIVVSKYKENVNWTNYFFNIMDVIIYNKGGNINNNINNKLPVMSKQINLPNVGREGHTIYYHICSIYDSLLSLSPEQLSNEYIIFLQGNPFDHSPNLFEKIQQIQNRSENVDFEYLSELCDNSDFLKEIQLHWKCYNIHNTYNKIFSNNNENMNVDFYFCEGAQFIVSKKAILKHSKVFYQNIISILDTEIDPTSGYDIERFHNIIFNK